MTKKMLAAGGYDFSGSILQNLGNGVSTADAVTVGQLNAAVAASTSNLDYKGSVRVASTANVSLTSAPATIDGVTLVATNRILLKDQTAGAENGIYVYTSTGAALTRATDADLSAEVTPGLWVTVEEGSTNLDTAWLLTTNGPIVIGTTALTFAKYTVASGGGVQKFAASGPASAGTTWAITHSLGTSDVVVSVREVATNAEVDIEVVYTSTTVVTVTAAASMAINAYRAVIIG